MSEENPFENKSLCNRLFEMMSDLDDPREIKDPDNEEKSIDAFISVRTTSVFNRDGGWAMDIEEGDVIVLQHGWDRNIIVTHLPMNTCNPIPFLLKDTVRGYGLKGVWLPIFDPSKIIPFVDKKMEQKHNLQLQ